MALEIFTDSAANIPREKVEAMGINVIPCSYEMGGKIIRCPEVPEDFDGRQFYDLLRGKAEVRTSMTNTHEFEENFEKALEKGNDVLYISISSGISGTYNASRIAAEELHDKYPERRIETFDSMGAGLGIGLLVLRAAEYRAQGMNLDWILSKLSSDRYGLCEYFTVDDLMHLRRGGRLSGVAAVMGTVLNIKPLLRGDEEGKIVAFSKLRGRKRAIAAIAEEYKAKVKDPASQIVAISHGDCLEDAETLAAMVRKIAEPRELIISMHEPFTGIHVGPGMLSLFFIGSGR
ncbi:MAG: DegV family protein [Oscillospiraceae bacterium]|nr:DegV family protein [Oscillospiraceae bacterium]